MMTRCKERNKQNHLLLDRWMNTFTRNAGLAMKKELKYLILRKGKRD